MIETLPQALAEIERLHKVMNQMQLSPVSEKKHGDFVSWGKTPRLFRPMVITEKLNGTNACVIVFDVEPEVKIGHYLPCIVDDTQYWVGAQSRNRLITPETDNAGFAAWVWANSENLVRTLDVGRNFGEWFGGKVQSKYGYKPDQMFFALFNVSRHVDTDFSAFEGKIIHVPVLYEGIFSEDAIHACVADLRKNGSRINNFPTAEGIVVFHVAANRTFKVLLENDEIPKGLSDTS